RHLGMAMAHVGHGDAGEKVEVLPAVRIPESGALAADQRQAPGSVRVQNMPIVKVFDLLNGVHVWNPALVCACARPLSDTYPMSMRNGNRRSPREKQRRPTRR